MAERVMKPRPGVRATVRIESVDARGNGICALGGYELRIRGGVPGDRMLVGIRKVRHRRREAQANVLELLEPGIPRSDAPCSHFGECGGCLWQNVSYEEQLVIKSDLVATCLSEAGCEIDLQPALEAPSPLNYRNKMEFSFGNGSKGLEIGLHASGRYDRIFNLSSCYLPPARSNDVVDFTRAFARRHRLSVYDLKAHRGLLRFLTVREGVRTAETMAILTTSEDPFELGADYGKALMAAVPSVTSVIHSVNRRKAQVAIGDEERVVAGRATIDDCLGDFRFEISPSSFFQPNTLQAERLFARIVEMADLNARDRVLDLYCGTGGISLFLSKRARSVLGIEVSDASIRDAVHNSAKNGVESCQFMAGSVEDLLVQLGSKGERFDVAVTDPPRPGMHPRALAALGELEPRRIVYVSCNPEALATDVVGLRRYGYEVTAAQLVDMLPQTPHCEVLACLDRVA